MISFVSLGNPFRQDQCFEQQLILHILGWNGLKNFEMPMLTLFATETGPANHWWVDVFSILSCSQALAIKVYKLIINEPLPSLTRLVDPIPLDQVRVLRIVVRRCYTFAMIVADVLVCGEEPMLAFFLKAVPRNLSKLFAVIRPVAIAGQTLSMSFHQSPCAVQDICINAEVPF